MSKTTTRTTSISSNNDNGSLHVGQALDPRFQKNGYKPQPGELLVNIEGEAKPRTVTYIMGSAAKGWSLCCKGAGPFARELSYSLTYEDGQEG